MGNYIFRKSLIIGLMILFVAAGSVQSISDNVKSIAYIDAIENLGRDTEIFYPSDDTCIKQQLPNTNFGIDSLVVRNKYGGGGQGVYEDDILIKFDLSDIPSGTEIISASLNLFYFKWSENNPASRRLNLHRIASSWHENTVTWNTRPSYTIVVTSYDFVPSYYTWMEWDVTSDVQDFVNGYKTNYGWQIMDENYWGTYDIPASWFRQKEHGSYKPYLEVEMNLNNPPNNPDTPSGPQGLIIDEIGDYSTRAVDPDDDMVRYRFDWDDGVISGWTGLVNSGESATKSHAWSMIGTYEVKAQARDEHGATSEWSQGLPVIVSSSEPPDKPDTPNGPTSGEVGISYTYLSSTSDPDGDQVHYWFDWGDGTNSGWLGPYNSGQTVSEAHIWNIAGGFPIKVKAKDIHGLESVWSDPLTVTMPRNKQYTNRPFLNFLVQYPNVFQALRYLLGL